VYERAIELLEDRIQESTKDKECTIHFVGMRIRHALLISVMALKLIVVLPAVGGDTTTWSRDMRKLIESGSHPIAYHVMHGHRQTGCWLASAYALVRSVRLRGGEEGTGVDESGEGVSGDDSDIEDGDDDEDTLSSVMAQQDDVSPTDDGASASHHSDRQRWRSSAGVGGEAGASAKREWPEEHAGMLSYICPSNLFENTPVVHRNSCSNRNV